VEREGQSKRTDENIRKVIMRTEESRREIGLDKGFTLIELLMVIGFPDQPGAMQFNWDMPASYHVGAGGLSFADGHSEIKRWLDPRTTPPLGSLRNDYDPLNAQVIIPSPNNPDIAWLQERATRRIQQ
jgi:hypothetical protein